MLEPRPGRTQSWRRARSARRDSAGRSLDGLVWCLQAVAVGAKQLGYRLVTDPNAALPEQFGGQHGRALARPPQRRVRVAPRDRIDELVQPGPHLRMRDFVRSFTGTPPNLDDVLEPRAGAGLIPSLPHRADRQASRARHSGHTAVTDRTRLRTRP